MILPTLTHTAYMLILSLLFIAYLVGINVYSFLLLKSQKDEYEDTGELSKAGDGRLILAAFLGGAIMIYLCMFLFRYRLKSLFLMLLLPVLSVLNVYIAVVAFRSGFSFIVV